jgi:hypothetical protein
MTVVLRMNLELLLYTLPSHSLKVLLYQNFGDAKNNEITIRLSSRCFKLVQSTFRNRGWNGFQIVLFTSVRLQTPLIFFGGIS